MKVEVENDSVSIKGNVVGKSRFLRIHYHTESGMDYFSISLVRDGVDEGILPSLHINGHVVLCRNNSLEKGEHVI